MHLSDFAEDHMLNFGSTGAQSFEFPAVLNPQGRPSFLPHRNIFSGIMVQMVRGGMEEASVKRATVSSSSGSPKPTGRILCLFNGKREKNTSESY